MGSTGLRPASRAPRRPRGAPTPAAVALADGLVPSHHTVGPAAYDAATRLGVV